MTTRPWRSLLAASFLTLAASACGLFANIGADEEARACELRPVDSSPASVVIGVQRVAALCAAMVEVDGRPYSVGVGRWLDEDALELEEYGLITRANDRVADPTAFSLRGVDPLDFLVMRGDGGTDDLGDMGEYRVLWGENADVPEAVCQYADPADIGYPATTCPLRPGRDYSVSMVVACGLEGPVGPYGGDYWWVIDAPEEPESGRPYPGMYLGIDYGQLELISADRAIYRSERGAEHELQRITDDPELTPAPCPSPSF